MTTPASTFAHILAYPADKKRFDQARESLRARSIRVPNQAEVTREMLDVWEILEPIRVAMSAPSELGVSANLTMPEAAKNLVEYWETT